MFELLIGLSGLLFGVTLAKISPEEMLPGEKYFRLVGQGLFTLTAILTAVMFWNLLSLIIIILMGLLLTQHSRLALAGNYFLLTLPFFYTTVSNQLVLASLIFMYGLPMGTLLWQKKI